MARSVGALSRESCLLRTIVSTFSSTCTREPRKQTEVEKGETINNKGENNARRGRTFRDFLPRMRRLLIPGRLTSGEQNDSRVSARCVPASRGSRVIERATSPINKLFIHQHGDRGSVE